MKAGDKVRLLVSDIDFNTVDIYTIDRVRENDILVKIDEYTIYVFSPNELKIVESTTPERYKTNSIDVIDLCKLYDLNFNLGSIVKYACRKKNQDIEDLKKIIDFAKREIKHLEKIEKQWEERQNGF